MHADGCGPPSARSLCLTHFRADDESRFQRCWPWQHRELRALPRACHEIAPLALNISCSSSSPNLGSLGAIIKGELLMKNKRIRFTAIIVALCCFTFLAQMHAVNPPPDGCYPNSTTAEGCKALQSLTTGAGNMVFALWHHQRQQQYCCWCWSA